jgi:hypothetical protein
VEEEEAPKPERLLHQHFAVMVNPRNGTPGTGLLKGGTERNSYF